jgi:hypothetical protein
LVRYVRCSVEADATLKADPDSPLLPIGKRQPLLRAASAAHRLAP